MEKRRIHCKNAEEPWQEYKLPIVPRPSRNVETNLDTAGRTARATTAYLAASGIVNRSPVCVAENLTTLVSFRPAARPASITSISRIVSTPFG